ncbi:unnamed protein product [Rhizoctonia solani]|uniref:NACHT domain-containing protein n=1 Tax=Rhizoctonia solani TaxID=456999 RepID=A0A8H3CFN8_9AGAM|nr:unnamed protein product [Rhizoctonia solani]
MDLWPFKSKRKRKNAKNAVDQLQPGRWRGGGDTASVSRSRSPTVSRASTPGTSDPNRPELSAPNSRRPSIIGTSPRTPGYNAPTTTELPSSAISQAPSNQETSNTTSARGLTRTAWTGLEQTLQALRTTTRACPPLYSAIDDLASCIPIFETAARNRKDYDDLATGLKDMLELLIRHLDKATSESISSTIKGIAERIRKEIDLVTGRQSRNGTQRTLRASGDEEDLIRRYRRIEQLFCQLQGEASLSTWNITNEHFVNTQLVSLRPAMLAKYDSALSIDVNRRQCTKNTRTNILGASLAWSENPGSEKIYWMNGMAGTGKTTIAYSLCGELETRKQLAASFFCTVTSPECQEAKRIVPTIAYQLARLSAPFRSALCEALEEDRDIGTGSISAQFELLLKNPLIKASAEMPNNLVVVVDALDECSDSRIIELFLGLLFSSASKLPIKFFVTSRPEPLIRKKMMAGSERSRSILYLHEIEQSLVQADISLYLKEELLSISPADADIEKLARRAGKLFIYAATAVRYILPHGKSVNSKERLAIILAVNSKSKERMSSIDTLYSVILTGAMEDDQLEDEEKHQIRLALWTTVCACEPVLISTLAAISGLGSRGKTLTSLESLRSVLHVSEHSELVTTLHASFPDYILNQERSGRFFCNARTHNQLMAKQCFGIMKAQLRFNICNIKSSFTPDGEIPDLEERIKTNISDELFYACRFWADHLHLVDSSTPLLRTLHDFLSKQLLFWMEVLNLKKCIRIAVAAIAKLNRWVTRQAEQDHDLHELVSEAQAFIVGYALHPISSFTPHIYLSALPFASSLRYLFPCYQPKFQGLLKVCGTKMYKIQEALLWTWKYSCLAIFSPKSNRIALGNESGDFCVRNASDGEYVIKPFKAHFGRIICMRYSHDGAQLITGSYDRTLSIWNAQDGTCIAGPFKGHTGGVTSVVFLPDAMYVVSGSNDCTIRIWPLHTTALPVKKLTGHTGGINSIDLSPNGSRIVSGSSDCTIRIWDISSGATIHILEDHKGPVRSIKFTSDGESIISFSPHGHAGHSHHCDIYVWDGSNGSFCGSLRPSQDSSQQIESMAISPDGDLVASSVGHSISLWDRYSGEQVAGPFEGPDPSDQIQSIEFSDDGTRIVSVSRGWNVRVWNLSASGKIRQAERIISRETQDIPEILAFAPNQTRIAVSGPTTIQIYDTNLRTMKHITSQIRSSIQHLQFSNDSTHIFSIHTSGEMCTWDTHTARLISGPYRCSTSEDVIYAACSVDGTRVVTRPRHSDHRVELWDAESNKSIASCEINYRDVIVFSQRGRRFISSPTAITKYDSIIVWDAGCGRPIAKPFSDAKALDFSPDGRYVIIICLPAQGSATSRALRLARMSKKEHIDLPLEGMPNIPHDLNGVSAKFSPDGGHVAYTIHGICRIWNRHSQEVVSTLNDPKTVLDSVAYSPDNWCLASGICSGRRREILRIWRFHIDSWKSTSINIGTPPGGWVLDSRSRPLFWVHTAIRDGFPLGSGFFIENGETLCVDYRGMLVGDSWGKCYIGN